MKDFKNKWALVTGASSGFGLDFASLLAESGANLVLAARRTAPMEELAATLRAKHGVQVVVEGIDLARPGVGAELAGRMQDRGIAVEILVNNAGCGVYGNFAEQPLDRIMDMVQLNVASLTELTHVFAQGMVKRGGGHILLVGSLVGFQATPTYAAYCASKAYVLLLGESLNVELAPHNVKVSVLAPGITATEFLKVSGQPDTFYQRMMMMRSRPVAQTGLKALAAGRASVLAGVGNKLTVFMSRFAPRALQSRIAHQLMKH